MTPFAIAAHIVEAVLGYVVVGGSAVVAIAYSSALTGKNWFGKSRGPHRWFQGEGLGGMAPVAVFWAWPLLLPGALLVFLGMGGAKVIEAIGEAAEKAGTKRERELRGAKPL